MTQRRYSLRRAGTLAFIAAGLLGSAASVSAQPACVGDCDGNGTVAINELVLAVNIALGSQPVTACEAADASGNGSVEINELVQAVNRALSGCDGSPTPTGNGGSPTPTVTPPVTCGDCPLDEGEYTITSGAGGMLRVASLSAFPFPPGGMVVQDVACGNAECVHEVVVKAEGGFFSPTFCIPGLGFSVKVAQNGCGVGRIDSNGGSDFTVRELGDTSDTEVCDFMHPGCTGGMDSSIRVDVTVGDGTADTCASGTGNALVIIPVHTTTWLENAIPGECPAADGTYNPEENDTLITEFDQILDFTTDSAQTQFMDLDSDGCSLAGAGPPGGFPAATGVCLDLDAGAVTTVASGPVGSSGSPLFDLVFVTTLPNDFQRTADRTNATCGTPPDINFTGEATRCLMGAE